jgi:hypothetical protein
MMKPAHPISQATNNAVKQPNDSDVCVSAFIALVLVVAVAIWLLYRDSMAY